MAKSIRKIVTIYILALAITGCTINEKVNPVKNDQAPEDRDPDIVKKEITTDTDIQIEHFNKIPDTIDGCGEYFTYTTNELARDKYIFVSNLSDFAIIQVNGKAIFMNKVSSESREIDDKSYINVYKGSGYKVILHVKQTRSYDEGGFYSGTIQVIKGNKQQTIHVHGETGC